MKNPTIKLADGVMYEVVLKDRQDKSTNIYHTTEKTVIGDRNSKCYLTLGQLESLMKIAFLRGRRKQIEILENAMKCEETI